MDTKNSWLPIVAVIGLVLFATKGDGCKNPPFPPTVTQGPKTVLLWYETKDAPLSFQSTITQLRAGESAKYLEAKGHLLLILDDDPNWETSLPGVKAAMEAVKVKGPPAVAIVDSATGSVVYSDKLDLTWDENKVLDLLKKHGG